MADKKILVIYNQSNVPLALICKDKFSLRILLTTIDIGSSKVVEAEDFVNVLIGNNVPSDTAGLRSVFIESTGFSLSEKAKHLPTDKLPAMCVCVSDGATMGVSIPYVYALLAVREAVQNSGTGDVGCAE